MKKYLNYAFAGAIALTGAVGFASCSSSGEDVVGNTPVNNPTNIPEQEAVKTQFTISLPSNVARANTRQSAATVQNAQTIASFRGMDNIVLLPFAATGDAGNDPVLSTAYKLSDKISLTKIIVPSEKTVTNSIPAATLANVSNSVLYKDVTIPVGTGSFLFYGKAIDNGSDDNFVNGSLSMTEGQPSAIKFDLVQTNSSSTVSSVGTAIATYLSNIAKATNWAGCADPTNSSQGWYNASLGYLYLKFTSMKAGSSRTTQAAVQDLYTTIKDNTDGVSTAIKNAIIDATYASDPGTGVLTFTAAIGNSEATYFPGDVNLPDGAALLSYDESTKTFTQKTDGNGNTGSVTAKYADYVYPASLYYYCNSGIKTSNTSQQSAYNGTDDWTTISGNYTDGTAVSTTTRSVAILDPIQYGVGRLDATVKLDAMTLYDKNGETYTVPAGGFTVTGILIGGQKQVNFDFKQNTSATTEYTIFDNVTKSNGSLSATTTVSATNYTLALETATDQAVKVAVELLNNGNAFEGADGIVPKGGKFYLIAELAPSNSPDYSSGTKDQVFKQDYKTIVTFTIKTGLSKTTGSFNSTTGNTIGLGAAHNLIPDFRTPQLELGLSVDMTWESGLQFGIDL